MAKWSQNRPKVGGTDGKLPVQVRKAQVTNLGSKGRPTDGAEKTHRNQQEKKKREQTCTLLKTGPGPH